MRARRSGMRRKIGVAVVATLLISTMFTAAADAAVVVGVVNHAHWVSHRTGGTQPTSGATSRSPALSNDGLFVAFISTADLVAADTNGVEDVYRKDVATQTTELVSASAAGQVGNGTSAGSYLDVSADGRYVVFASDASNLVAGDANNRTDVFRKDMANGAVERVNVSDDESLVAAASDFFAASDDGDHIAFIAEAAPNIGNGQGVYVRHLAVGATQFVAATGGPAPIAMSGDGLTLAYSRFNETHCGFPTPPTYTIRHHVFTGGANTLVGTNSSNFCDQSGVLGPNALSLDGKTLAMWSDGDTCCNAEVGPKPRAVFAWNYDAFVNNNSNSVRRVSETQNAPKGLTWAAHGGTNANADSAGGAAYPKGSISSDGRKVAFTSAASNLDINTASGAAFVKDLDTGAIRAHSREDGDYTGRPVVDAVLNGNATLVGFSTAHQMAVNDTNAGQDVYTRALSAPQPTAPGPPAPANVSLAVAPTPALPGFSSLPSSAVPATTLPLDALSAIAGAPLRSVDVASSPLRSVPLRSVPLRSVPLRSVPLRSVTLSELPLLSGTWETILATLSPNPFVGVPLQAITLDAVMTEFDKQPNATGLGSVTLGNVDLSSTPLRSVSVASILLGATPLRSVQVGAAAPPDAFGDWCTILAGLGYSCATLGLTADSPVLAADLAGVPLRSVPLRSVPLRSVPLRSVDVGSAPLRSVPLRSVKYTGDLGSMLLSKIRDRNVDGTLGASNPGLLVDCADAQLFGCTSSRTLSQATSAGAFIEGKTIGDLVDHVDPADITGTLGELIAAIVDTANYPWETLELDGLQPLAGANAKSVEFTAHFEVTGTGADEAQVSVVLPPGFVYKKFSTVDHDDSYSEPVVSGQTLSWQFDVNGGESHDIVFDAYSAFDLATGLGSTLTVDIGSVQSSASGQPIAVVEDFETGICTTCVTAVPIFHVNDSPAGAVAIAANTMMVSHIGESGDIDYYKLPVPPKGTRIQVRLGNHSDDADFDVVMFNGTTDSTPLRSVPLRSVPLRSVPLADNGVDASAADSAVSPETLDDIPNVEGAPLRSVGENRGTADELLSTVSDADPELNESQQHYLLQVSAYNGGSSASPYVLYVKQYTPPPAPACPTPKAYANAGEGVLGAVPGSLPADLNTLFLVDKKRMGNTYGAAAAQQVIDRLTTLAGREDLGVTGVVYPVDGNLAARTALDNWDLDPCSPDAANRAFNAVGEVVDSVRADRPTLKNIVVVGGDDILPMARVADYTQISNESDYGQSLLLSSGANRGTPIAAAAINQNILTDDPLGDVDPIPWLDHALYVPDLAVGRMVETPAEIVGQIDSFIASGGVLAPQSSLTTGYDFLTDGAEGVDAALASAVPDAAKRSKLVNETWAKADVLAALYPASGPPDIASVNAHYDHTRSLPALGNSTGDESDLVTTAEIAAHPETLTKRLLFTMGCHAGLPMPKSYTDVEAKDADWAQAYASKQAAVYFANTGFGYGDTAAVALSEELMRLFALRLDGTMTVGEAAVYAKQAYFGQLGAYGPYDEKAMQEATFFGLPMWKVAGGGAPVAPPKVTPAVDGTGVLSAPVSIAPSFTKKTSKGGGQFYEASAAGAAASGLQVTQYRPIEPRLSVDVTPDPVAGPDVVAHGVLVTALDSHDETIVPAMARPVIDLTASEPPPPAGDVSFPTTFQNLTTFNTPTGERQHVVFLPGQFFRDAAWESAGGVQRLFDGIGAEVKYSDSEDFLAPQLTDVASSLVGGQLTITLRATEESTDGVQRVVVLVKDQSGDWTLRELTESNGMWTTGAFPVVGTQVEYFAQAQDLAGNVGVTTNKGRYFSGLPATTSAGTPKLSLLPPQPTGSNGWYRSQVSVALTGAPGQTYTRSVDGGAPGFFSPSSPVTLFADGTHSVKAVGSPDGSSAMAVVAIDKTAPALASSVDRPPNANGWYNAPVTATVTGCTDATSGVQVCPPSGTISANGADVGLKAFDFAGNMASGPIVNVDTVAPSVVIAGVSNGAVYSGVAPDATCSVTDALSGPAGCTGVITNGPGAGFYTYTATGRDKAGNTAVAAATFKATYLFGGFLQPVNDTAHFVGSAPPPHSVFAGGSTVPLKFKLVKQDGTAMQASSTPTFFGPVYVGPIGGVGVNEPTVNAPATSGSFVWDPATSTYAFNWKTNKKTQSGSYWRVGVTVDGKAFTVIIGLR